jgi:hypothetical protein
LVHVQTSDPFVLGAGEREWIITPVGGTLTLSRPLQDHLKDQDSMKTKTKPCTIRLIRWLSETRAEMDYLQHRLIELQMDARSLRVPPNRWDVEALDAIYALPSRAPNHGLE